MKFWKKNKKSNSKELQNSNTTSKITEFSFDEFENLAPFTPVINDLNTQPPVITIKPILVDIEDDVEFKKITIQLDMRNSQRNSNENDLTEHETILKKTNNLIQEPNHKISDDTQKLLQNQQTKILDHDDIEDIICKSNNHIEETNITFEETKINSKKIMQNKSTMMNFEQEMLKFKAFEESYKVIKPNQTKTIKTEDKPAMKIDYNRLSPVTEDDVNLRVKRTNKRKV
ncbi:MAG: hypothetical protein ACRC4L_03455 [Mycoplasma sp.]